MKTVELAVPTVHCTSCKLNIEECLDELTGVGRCEVDVGAKRVFIEYDPAAVDRATITAAIEDAGYPVSA
jgi:copper chaperone CopZ